MAGALKKMGRRRMHDPNDKFDRLLDAMAHGHAPVSGKKKPSGDQASDAERRAYCDETRTPRDTSEDASR